MCTGIYRSSRVSYNVNMANKKARTALNTLRITEPVSYFCKSETQFALNIISANGAENKIRTWVIKGDTVEKISEDTLSDYNIEKIEAVKIGPFRRATGIRIQYKLDLNQIASKLFLLPDNLPLFIVALSGTELDSAINRLQSGN
jgi:hypothetical protein